MSNMSKSFKLYISSFQVLLNIYSSLNRDNIDEIKKKIKPLKDFITQINQQHKNTISSINQIRQSLFNSLQEGIIRISDTEEGTELRKKLENLVNKISEEVKEYIDIGYNINIQYQDLYFEMIKYMNIEIVRIPKETEYRNLLQAEINNFMNIVEETTKSINRYLEQNEIEKIQKSK